MFLNKNWKTNFALLWAGQIISLLGTSIIQFSLIWWITEKTGSAILLSIAALSTLIPEIFIGPFIGPVIDRSNKKKILFFSGISISIIALVLSFGFHQNLIVPWMILIGLLLRSIFNVSRWPVLSAAAAQIVPENHLTRINAVDYMIRGFSNIIGPITGAFLINSISIQKIMLTDVLLVLIGFIPLFLVKIPEIINNADAMPSIRKTMIRNWNDLKDGFIYVQKKPGLLKLLAYLSIINLLLIPGDHLLPLMISDHFGGGATELGMMGMAFGIGSIVGGLILGMQSELRSRMKTSISGDILYGAAVILIGISTKNQFPLAILAWGAAGIGESLSLASLNALLQSRTKPEMQGRVISITSSLINISVPLGMIISGPVAEFFGIHQIYIFSGIVVLLISGSMINIPNFFQYEKNKPVRSFDQSYY
ncbi:MFS transporter [Flexilinea flocculi]|uniref:Predicted arabinose efflux permease, MFS family n=1 Tax=Flexilinea flocculi TaxID=1678840 RepID=A0A0S7BZN0_9CHLR|nr:MFS transporter [Flexilinea flocculi]GAP41871.1 predicted arabinose efflux permease, MFS family [Flexilinea flocculi]